MKRIALLGATGSIGRSTVDVVERHREELCITVVAGYSRADELAKTAVRVGAKVVVIEQESVYTALKEALSHTKIEAQCGKLAIEELCGRDDVDIVLNALVGAAGVSPTLRAIRYQKPIALANKETLVCGGAFVMREAKASNTAILPVDSEHSAVFQALIGEPRARLKRLILTASGGPFRDTPFAELKTITPEAALKHPTWVMGPKVTIDSSTLVNKGLELIEARWLFDTNAEEMDVTIHPQSIIHSMVEFADGSIKAQMSNPDMRLPIQFALSYPDRWESNWVPNNLAKIGTLTFFEPDEKKFPALRLAKQVLRGSDGMAAVFNAADEIAVPAFLQKRISYLDIPAIIEAALTQFDGATANNVEELFALDNEVRVWTTERVKAGTLNG